MAAARNIFGWSAKEKARKAELVRGYKAASERALAALPAYRPQRTGKRAGDFIPPRSRKTPDELNREFLERQTTRRTALKSATFKGRKIDELADGSWVIPSIDRESHFDSLQDAKAFITSWKRNPQKAITDRAHRYRANNLMPAGPKVCALCGKKSGLMVDHKDGHPDHTTRGNLQWLCRPCNTAKRFAFRNMGKGRLTHQYNPAGKEPPTYEQYLWAVAHQTGREYVPGRGWSEGDHGEAGSIIHATPKTLRSEYAARAAGLSQRTKRARADERWNPAEESVQDRSWREWAENFERVARAPEKASDKDLRRAIGYLDHARRSMIRRTQEAGKQVDANVLAGYDNEYDYYVSLVRKREKGNPAVVPPNLRPATGPESCGTCGFFNCGQCMMFGGFPVISSQVCDDYVEGVPGTMISNPSKFDRCVKQVQARGGNVNAYAVCTAAGTRNPANDREYWYRTPTEAFKVAEALQKRGIKVAVGNASQVAQKQGYMAVVRILSRKKRRNPESSAASLYESFHGVPSTQTLEVEEQEADHEHLTLLGRLVDCWVITLTGFLAHFEFDEDPPVWCSSSEDGRQLYFAGGDQEIDLAAFKMDGSEWIKDRMVIGQFAPPMCGKCGEAFEKRGKVFTCPKCGKKVTYEDHDEKDVVYNLGYNTRKQFDAMEPIDYQHDLGEETGIRPMLEYDPRVKRLFVTGGQYRIEQPLFEMSPGIEN